MATVDIVEVELTPLDQLYYVSREAGDEFGTRPFVMHTALYYAFGLLPSRYRVIEQTPRYREHYNDSAAARGVYIHPAIPKGTTAGRYTTRRFAVKPDTFRQQTEQENKNLKETGFQRFIDPGTPFRTFVRVDDGNAERLTRQLEGYCRLGKKMTGTRLRTAHHTAEVMNGDFELGQPIGNADISGDSYDLLGGLRMESMVPVNLITEGQLSGAYVRVEPRFSEDTGPVALPVEAEFLREHQ